MTFNDHPGAIVPSSTLLLNVDCNRGSSPPSESSPPVHSLRNTIGSPEYTGMRLFPSSSPVDGKAVYEDEPNCTIGALGPPLDTVHVLAWGKRDSRRNVPTSSL